MTAYLGIAVGPAQLSWQVFTTMGEGDNPSIVTQEQSPSLEIPLPESKTAQFVTLTLIRVIAAELPISERSGSSHEH